MSASPQFTKQKKVQATRQEVLEEYAKRALGQDSPIWMKLRDKFWLFLIPLGAGYGLWPADFIPDSPLVVSFIDDFIVSQLPLVALGLTNKIKQRWIRKKLAKAQHVERYTEHTGEEPELYAQQPLPSPPQPPQTPDQIQIWV
ncbi:MAG TPA: hypothetical protein VFM68_01275 [Candidatus Saccharimonadales bacterium]|nr:hypothetical protein [Candidatus Saccharimonadales bacterium]